MALVLGETVTRPTDIARVIDAEFDEMPGMRLTAAQVRRLWNLSQQEADVALGYLCRAGRLVQDETGRYFRCRFDH